MKTEVIITVTVVRTERGRRRVLLERSISEEGGIPSQLAQKELLQVAHEVICPNKTDNDTGD
jgi:hypothetical protein